MNNPFSFGEKIPEYDMKVLNEREVRASAGILFLFAMISFLNSWLIGDFTITKIFVVVFLVEFSIRVLINPKYAPLLVISRFFVRHQEVEYVGAPQKRFAWIIGLVLAVIMFYLVVLNNVIGPFNLLVCVICLTLLFFEAAFGICLGCKIYNLFHKEKAQLCPGNACAIKDRAPIQNINFLQFVLVPLFLGMIYVVANSTLIHASTNKAVTDVVASDCVIPDWVQKIGHEEKWKLHNGCADNVEKKTEVAAEHVAPAAVEPKDESKEEKDCTIPQYAIALGHEEKWKLHNGCVDNVEKKTEVAAEHVVPAAVEPKGESKEEKDCTIPQYAIALGHEEKWKLHNGCVDSEPKKTAAPKAKPVVVAATVPTPLAVEHDSKAEKDCTIPQFAIDMGHEEQWKEHNGCADGKSAEPEAPIVEPVPVPPVAKVQEAKPEEKDCTVPQFAIALGHEEKWKLHNGCQ